jgi:addiction module HigA family antidote
MARRPTHPGDILREDVLPQMRMAMSEFARILGMSRQHLHRVLHAQSPVSSDTAVKLGALFGNDPKFWLNLQDRYDIWESEQKLHDQLIAIEEVRTRMSRSWDYEPG